MPTTIDLVTPGSSTEIDGAIFVDSANIGSGTGNYNTFLALGPTPPQSGNEQGFNSDDTPPIDSSNQDIDHAKTHTVLLSTVPIVVIDGVEYYEFRVDLNEANSNPSGQISLDQFKIYTSTDGSISSTTTLFQQNLVYDMDDGAQGDVSLQLSEVSTGSGTDDYAVLVPVSRFEGLDPATTYMYLYVDMGSLGGDYVAASGFEEWNLQTAGTLTGTKFSDLDADGVRDDGEPGVEGVTIFIDNNFVDSDGDGNLADPTDNNGILDDGERWTVTDEDGNYTFFGVPLGTWRVDEVVPDGATQTTGDFETVTIDAIGETVTVDPIGNFTPFDISGTKYTDVDGDGTIDAEDTGLGGVTIFIDMDDSGDLSGGDLTTVTAADGSWSFSDLDDTVAGRTVYEVLPDGYVQTLGEAGYELNGGDQEDLDFANFELFDISGTKFTDVDGDGTIDAEDTGLGGVTIFIDMDDSGDLSGGDLTTVTAADGSWSFTDLDDTVAGRTVYEVLPDGYVQTLGAAGYEITGTSGADQEDLDFANFELFDISGTKFTDVDGDGTIDAEDTGLGGVTVFIDMDDSGDLSGGDLTTVTAADGSWSFTDLDDTVAGRTVYEVLPDGYVQTLGAAGYEITGTSGADQEDLDFANFELFDIEGFKFADLNGNGEWDEGSGEDGIAGWTIYLDDDTDPTNGVIATALTNGDGRYQFIDLGPDSLESGTTYFIYEQQQNGWTQTFDGATSFTLESGNDLAGTFGEAEDFNFGNQLIEGAGTRTPGFWSSPNGREFWDGIVGNETKAGQDGFADGELTYQVDSNCDGVRDGVQGLLIGDYDRDGLTGPSEDTIFISLTDAVRIINASQKDQQDARFVLARDTVATWLNYLAGNPIGDADDPTSAHFYLDAAIDWLQTTTGAPKDEDCSAWSTSGGSKVKASSSAWNVGLDTQGTSTLELGGNTIHSQLDEFNNTGSIDDSFLAFDGDFVSDQQHQYLAMLQSAAA